VKYLREQNASYHTYQLNTERAYGIVVRGLYHTSPPESINRKARIQSKGGFTQYTQTKTPLPLFFVDLKPSPENKTIFCVKSLYHSKVSIEDPYKRREIVQCKRCYRLVLL
jgi:hypothetical protein